MSLLSYQDARPWIRSIKTRVAGREMPPWFLDKTVGVQKFINDASLSDEQIDPIVRWVDAGAPMGRRGRSAAGAAVAERRRVLSGGACWSARFDRQSSRLDDAGAGA